MIESFNINYLLKNDKIQKKNTNFAFDFKN